MAAASSVCASLKRSARRAFFAQSAFSAFLYGAGFYVLGFCERRTAFRRMINASARCPIHGLRFIWNRFGYVRTASAFRTPGAFGVAGRQFRFFGSIFACPAAKAAGGILPALCRRARHYIRASAQLCAVRVTVVNRSGFHPIYGCGFVGAGRKNLRIFRG